MTTPRAVATEVRQALKALTEIGTVAYSNPVLETPQRVSWNTATENARFLLSRDDLTVEGYLHWLESGHFSAMLNDASLLQITYEFDGHTVIGHRLAFVPCPVSIDTKECRELLDAGEPWAEVVKMQLFEVSAVMMKTPLRFDYDPVNARAAHPAAHFTMNSSDCRIACATPFRLGRFLDFVFRNFYPLAYKQNSYLRGFDKDGWFPRTITQGDLSIPHLAWGA